MGRKIFQRWLAGALSAIAIVLCAVCPVTVLALDIPSAPSETAIADEANVIDAATETRISEKLINYKKQTGNEIAVLTIKSLEGEDIFDYSQKVFQKWGIGSASVNNGARRVYPYGM